MTLFSPANMMYQVAISIKLKSFNNPARLLLQPSTKKTCMRRLKDYVFIIQSECDVLMALNICDKHLSAYDRAKYAPKNYK